jgi:hypothetical protein
VAHALLWIKIKKKINIKNQYSSVVDIFLKRRKKTKTRIEKKNDCQFQRLTNIYKDEIYNKKSVGKKKKQKTSKSNANKITHRRQNVRLTCDSSDSRRMVGLVSKEI